MLSIHKMYQVNGTSTCYFNSFEFLWTHLGLGFQKSLAHCHFIVLTIKLMDDERVWELQLFMPKGELLTTDASKIWPMFLMSEYWSL